MVLKVFNTLTRKKETFKPIETKKVTLFVCGPTVYDFSHLGHLRTYLAFDIIANYLRFRGYDVFYLMNITDIDDKIIKKAKEEKIDPLKLAKHFEKEFYNDLKQTGIFNNINLFARASEHIPEIINQIEILIEKKYAYRVDNDIYFDIKKFPDYGKLSNQKLDELKTIRIEPDKRKKNIQDFSLWKNKTNEKVWSSPWGDGRPGWHIEDTAITLKHLGTNYCIHGGAVELAFPHHEAEIAQAESVTGIKPLAKYWMHTGLLMIKEQKMSKSLKNYVSIKNILDKYDSSTLKLFFASSHYRSPIDFKQEYLGKTQKNISNIINTYSRLNDLDESKTKNEFETKILQNITISKRKFFAAMDDDINTPIAISHFLEIIHQVNIYCETNLVITLETKNNIMCFIQDLGNILGLNILELYSQTKNLQLNEGYEESKKYKEEIGDANINAESPALTAEQIEKEIEKRNQYRKNKKWEEADLIRQNLEYSGIILEDIKTANGTTKTQWKIKK